MIADTEYTLNCEVIGSVPDTDIRWTQNNRPFKRGQVSGGCNFFFVLCG